MIFVELVYAIQKMMKTINFVIQILIMTVQHVKAMPKKIMEYVVVIATIPVQVILNAKKKNN